MIIGENIRKIRQIKGYKQEVVAQKLGISQKAYSNIENNETDVTLSRLHQISEALEVTIDDILNWNASTIFNNVYNNEKVGTFHNNSLSSEERKLFEQLIQAKDQQIQSLNDQIQLLKVGSKSAN